MSNVLALPSNLPVGFRFHPTDEELINYFWKLKTMGKDAQVDHIIAEVDLCNWEPWELPSKSRVQSNDTQWWFLCRRGPRPKRTTGTGYWKSTGQDKDVKGKDGKTCIAKKKTLVFHKGRHPGEKTNWVIHEYYVETDNALLPHQRAYVVCRLKKKSNDMVKTPNGNEGQPSRDFISDFENLTAPLEIPGVHGYPEQTLVDNWQEMSMQFPNGSLLYGADESEECLDEFADSLIVDPDENGETANNVVNIFSLQPSSKRAYFGNDPVSSDTDTDRVHRRRVRQMRMVKTPGETLRTSAGEHSRVETIDPLHSRFSEEDTSSDDLIERPKSVVVSREGYQRRIQAQKKVSPPAMRGSKVREAAKDNSTAVEMPLMEKPGKESQNAGKMVVQSSKVVEKHLKSASCESSPVSKWKSFFTFEETSSLSRCSSKSPSEYCFNAVVGTILFVAFVRELVIYGSW